MSRCTDMISGGQAKRLCFIKALWGCIRIQKAGQNVTVDTQFYIKDARNL